VSSPRVVDGALRAYIEGVAALSARRDEALKVLSKYLRQEASVEELDYATKYLVRNPRVEPAMVQTVLGWLGAKDVPVSKFYDNTTVDRLAQEGFIDKLWR